MSDPAAKVLPEVTCGACEVDEAPLDLTPSLAFLIALIGVGEMGHEHVVKCLCPGHRTIYEATKAHHEQKQKSS
jgi:hypothetical protein